MKKSILIILCVVMLFMISCGKKSDPWPEAGLGSLIPEPPGIIDIYHDSDLSFNVWAENVTGADYNSYVEKCIEAGYTIESHKTTSEYEAFNEQGYKLETRFSSYSKKISIDFEPPIEMTTLRWPGGTAGKLVPEPDSKIGNNKWEYDDSFCLYVGGQTLELFNSYIEKCAEAGFTVDYSRGDNFYYADNEEGFSLTLKYEGFGIVFVRIDGPDEESTNELEETVTEYNEESKVLSEKENDLVDEQTTDTAEMTELEPQETVVTDTPPIDPETYDTVSPDINVTETTDTAETPPEETSKPTKDNNSLYYSSNDSKKAKEGNSGIFSYKSKGGSYSIYWIIDFDEGYVYYFIDGNGDDFCDRIKIVSGTLNDYVLITYHEGTDSWDEALSFKWSRQPDHLIFQDSNMYTWDYYPTNLEEALAIRDKKTIIDY